MLVTQVTVYHWVVYNNFTLSLTFISNILMCITISSNILTYIDN